MAPVQRTAFLQQGIRLGTTGPEYDPIEDAAFVEMSITPQEAMQRVGQQVGLYVEAVTSAFGNFTKALSQQVPGAVTASRGTHLGGTVDVVNRHRGLSEQQVRALDARFKNNGPDPGPAFAKRRR